MLTFFRRIRKGLVKENRISRYLFYAIGEIVLVVVGILIALQINTWKSESDNRSIEHEYYCQLLDDLELDRLQLGSLTQEHRQNIETGKQLIRDLHSHTRSKDELLLDFVDIARSKTYVPTNAAFTDLMSSGNLGLLQNKDLKSKLISFNSELENLIQILVGNTDYQTSQIIDWEDVLEFGWQSESISAGLELDDDLLALLPQNNWHLNSDDPYFQKMQEVSFICITISNRKSQIYEQILEEMDPLYKALVEVCNRGRE